LHACVGVAGETGELRQASSRPNLKEECGDTEFYIEAAWQMVTNPVKADRLQMVEDFQHIAMSDIRGMYVTFGNVLDNIHSLGADILDHAKKVWAYEDGNRDEKIGPLLCLLEYNLLRLYEFIGTTRSEIKAENMAKLAKRYATSSYSNEQALARADKDPMAGRNFIGQKTASANN
jgi:hypothetical protein